VSAEQTPLTADVRELLAAIRVTLDVPLAAHHSDDRAAFEAIRTRATFVRGVLELADGGYMSVESMASALRRLTADHPIAYTPHTPGGDQ